MNIIQLLQVRVPEREWYNLIEIVSMYLLNCDVEPATYDLAYSLKIQ